ncbi:dioxygenase [Mycolicibacterium moriokaense]|uniref:dioxygenase n=1 Tax=Mycolicibacterium moriokaense TaxID=39691 RepID=UPI001C647C78|nr:dioxygenase [Mycolicibacterium moriokaense]
MNTTRAAAATTSEQITETVLAAVAPTSDPRVREVVSALIRHAHDLAREVRLQPSELLATAHYLKRCDWVGDPERCAAAGRTAPFWELHQDLVLVAGESSDVTFSTGRSSPR